MKHDRKRLVSPSCVSHSAGVCGGAGVSALFVMWVLYNPLIRFLGERRVIILGLFINFLFFVGYLFLVTSLAWVFLFTAVGMVGSASSNDRALTLSASPC